mmetsp:Transcript_33542/g.66290  ORF Transcript_33542/g.66290 Transcript_33542/m.66290 type:complete len:335 (+) Transcript_33542:175-1179(+)
MATMASSPEESDILNITSSPAEPNVFDDELNGTETMQLATHDQLPSLEEVHQKSSLDLPTESFEEKRNTRKIRRSWLCIAIVFPFIVVALIITFLVVFNSSAPVEEFDATATVGGPGSPSTTTEEVLGPGTVVGGSSDSQDWKVYSQDSTTPRPTLRPTAKITDPPTATVKTRMELAKECLGRVSDAALFEDDELGPEEFAQARALEWIVNTDNQQLPVPAAASPDSYAGRFVQRYALAVMYYSMAEVLEFGGTDNWRKEFDFLSEKNECEWNMKLDYTAAEQVYYYGVSCDYEGRVTSIVMPKNRLQGTIPPEIELFPKNLKKLSFLDNTLPD